jgi:hypothetical protein
MKDSAFYMAQVAQLAVVLSVAEKESINTATIKKIRAAYLEARQKYTNPFNVNKYQR